MKKFFKFIFGTATVAAAGAGLYYAYKKFATQSFDEEEDDFEDDLDDFELDDDDEEPTTAKAPEYVSINPAPKPAEEPEA